VLHVRPKSVTPTKEMGEDVKKKLEGQEKRKKKKKKNS